MPGSMLILTWVGIIFVKILHLAFAWCKIMTNIMPTHVKISIEPGIRELFLNFIWTGNIYFEYLPVSFLIGKHKMFLKQKCKKKIEFCRNNWILFKTYIVKIFHNSSNWPSVFSREDLHILFVSDNPMIIHVQVGFNQV